MFCHTASSRTLHSTDCFCAPLLLLLDRILGLRLASFCIIFSYFHETRLFHVFAFSVCNFFILGIFFTDQFASPSSACAGCTPGVAPAYVLDRPAVDPAPVLDAASLIQRLLDPKMLLHRLLDTISIIWHPCWINAHVIQHLCWSIARVIQHPRARPQHTVSSCFCLNSNNPWASYFCFLLAALDVADALISILVLLGLVICETHAGPLFGCYSLTSCHQFKQSRSRAFISCLKPCIICFAFPVTHQEDALGLSLALMVWLISAWFPSLTCVI